MRLVIAVLMVAAVAALAGGEFSTGDAELLKFKGYVIGSFEIYGEEDADPDMGFDVIASIAWQPKLNDYVDAKIEFKAKPTKFEGSYEDLSLTTENIHLNLNLSENVTVSMGQFKRPFGYNYTRSGSSMFFQDRALLVDGSEFGKYGKRDIGFNLNVSFDMVNFDLAFTNGAGDNEPEDDSHKQFTIRGEIEPIDGITIAGAFGSYAADDPDTTNDDTFSSTGIDIYGVVDYPISDNADIIFVGEYLMLGLPGPEISGSSRNDATAYAFTLAPDFAMDGPVLFGVQPAIRYESYSPSYYGDTDPENDYGAIDFCLNLDLFHKKNTLQIGARNYTFEDENMDGYTDMYIGWRMKY
jgi:hypothetical protein